VQVVVEVPAFVGDPQVVRLCFHHVGEGHEVGRHDFVHVPHGVEGVQLVVARGPVLEVRALVEQEVRRRVQSLSQRLDDAAGRVTGEEVDGRVGIRLAQRPRDGHVALDVPETDGAGEPEDPALRRARRRARGGFALDHGRHDVRRDGTVEHEVADEPVDLDRLATHHAVAPALERDEPGARDRLREASPVVVRDDRVLRAVNDERRHGDLRQQIPDVVFRDLPDRLDEDLGRALSHPLDAVLHAFERVRLGQ
jgi:hypothetical protein